MSVKLLAGHHTSQIYEELLFACSYRLAGGHEFVKPRRKDTGFLTHGIHARGNDRIRLRAGVDNCRICGHCFRPTPCTANSIACLCNFVEHLGESAGGDLTVEPFDRQHSRPLPHPFELRRCTYTVKHFAD